MEFTNEFVVPTDIETAWRTLTDLERVAPCLPGATLEEVDGDAYSGRVKVKVGPVTMTYRGTAELVDVDAEARRARIDARGREARGSGTASADVTATLTDTDGGTLVHVVTDLAVTGKPAQFGRGVMEDVGTRIIDQFAQRLERLVLSDDTAAPTAASDTTAPAGSDGSATGAAAGPSSPSGAASGPRLIAQDPDRENEALDLVGVAGAATLKRTLPLLGALLLVAFIVRRVLDRR